MLRLARLVLSFLALERAFKLAAKGKDDAAWALLNRRWFAILPSYPRLTLSLEFSLLKLYLATRRGERLKSSRIFTQIWVRSKVSWAEKNFLTRYALTLLWISRGRGSE